MIEKQQSSLYIYCTYLRCYSYK